jgi:hypothetical protein
MEALLGTADIPEISMTSSTAPGVTHDGPISTPSPTRLPPRGFVLGSTNRVSTRLGTDMGRKIGNYIVLNIMQPLAMTTNAR